MSVPSTATGDSGPRLEWCDRCDRPHDFCQCLPEPVGADSTSGRLVGVVPVGHRSPVGTEPVDGETSGRSPVDTNTATGRSLVTKLASLGSGVKAGIALLAILALALGGVGFAVSFSTVAEAVEPAFDSFAWLVPTGVDLGILVFSGLNMLLAWLNIHIGWLRWVPRVLTLATIWLNVTAYDVVLYQVAHAVLPLLWIVVCEVITHVLAILIGTREGTRTEPIPKIRWVLAPVSTARLWRLQRVWGVTSYHKVLESERQRIMARTALSCKHGWTWRWTAPPMLRARYRLRELSDADVWGWQEGTTKTQKKATGDRPVADRPATGDGKPVAKAAPKPTGATGSGRRKSSNTDRSRKTGSTSDRLATAWAKFTAEGVSPSGQQLADAADCSKTVANDWKNGLVSKGGK